MNSDNNFNQSFRDRLRGFEATPDEQVWVRIEAELREKKKRRVIPFWWRLSGVAAALILASAVYYAFFRHTESPAGQVVEQQHHANPVPHPNAPLENTNRENAIPLGQAVADKDSSVAGEKTLIEKTNSNRIDPSPSTPTFLQRDASTAVAASGNQTQRKPRPLAHQPGDKIRDIGNTVATENGHHKREKSRMSDDQLDSIVSPNSIAEKPAGNQAKNAVSGNDLKTEEKIVPNASEKLAVGNDKPSAANPKKETKSTSTDNGPATTPETKKDSTAIATAEPNTLEELLNEKEKQVTSGQESSRWQVTPSVAPIYFSSASNGSPLDSRFEKNKKSYTPSLSYGVGAKYAVSKKLAVRAGVHALKLEYNTGDLVFSQTANARRLENVKPNLQGSLIEIDNKPAYPSFVGRSIDSYGGQVTQKIGYVEIPVELSYKLVDRKFGVELIGGISTLVLNDNQVLLTSEGLQMPIGEADNLNRVHFSSNLGVGLRYNFLKSFQASVDPMLKYQIGTFSDGAGNFKPYFLGLYTGLSYRF